MSDPGVVVVLTESVDPTADLVIAEMDERGLPVARFDSGDFPAGVALDVSLDRGGWVGTITTSTGCHVDLANVRSLYHRRPSPYAFGHLGEQDARWAAAEARHGLGGVLASLNCLYVNHPRAIQTAEYKPAGLAVAARCGFAVPATIITSCPATARKFAETQSTVYKPLAAVPYTDEGGALLTISTTRVSAEEIDERIAGTAHLFQAEVAKVADVRVTVIGTRIFSVRIQSPLLDWRTDYDAIAYSVIDTPPAVAEMLHRYLAAFKLVYGAFDFAVDESGTWWFLECNPAGQYAWMEPPTGLPMTSAVADLLERARQ